MKTLAVPGEDETSGSGHLSIQVGRGHLPFQVQL